MLEYEKIYIFYTLNKKLMNELMEKLHLNHKVEIIKF